MSFCPNKSSEQYKALVSQLGEANAYNAWFLHNKDVLTGKKPTIIKPGVEELFDSNPELVNAVYKALGFRTPNITVLPNGNLKIVAFRTEKVGPTSKGEYQRGKGLYLSLDKPYPGEDVYTVELEISPKNLLDRKLGFGEISEDYFIDEKNKRVDRQLDTLHEFKQSLGIKAEIGSIDGALMNELVLFDKELIDKALTSKQVYNSKQKQQAQQLYSQYLDSIFPDSKVKDVVYHGANEPIEGEKFAKREGATGRGIWFSGSRKYAQIQMDRAQPSESLIGRKLRGAPTMYQVVLNIKNPKNFYNATGALLVQTPSKFEEQYDRKTNDAALFHHPNSKKPATADSADQVVVFEPEQIHILGNKQDVEGFKQFVENPIVEPIIPTVEQAEELIKTIKPTFSITKESLTFEQEYKQAVEKYRPNVPKELNTVQRIIAEINRTYKTLKATINRSEGDSFTIELYKPNTEQYTLGVLDKLMKLVPEIKEVKIITLEEAQDIIGNDALKANAFIKGRTIYMVGKEVNDETLIEEFLHPFVEYLYQNTPELFNNFLEESKKDKDLFKSIATRYNNFTVAEKQKELVTQKLAQLLNAEYVKPQNEFKEAAGILNLVLKEFVKFFQKLFGGTFLLQPENINPNITLGQLARILNTKDVTIPSEFLYKPTFSLLDEVKKQSMENNYRLEEPVYKDKSGAEYPRLTEWIKQKLSKLSGVTDEDFAKSAAKKMFKLGKTRTNESGELVLIVNSGKEVTMDELIQEKLEDFKVSRAYGKLSHLLIERALKKKMGEDITDINLKIQALVNGSETRETIDENRYSWIEPNIERIIALAGLNIGDTRLSPDKLDKVLSELPFISEELNIGTTIDGLIEHPDGTLSIKDWKTGNILSDSFTPQLLSEYGNQLEPIRDSKLDRAKLEVVLRAMMIKLKNPNAKFRSLSVEYLNKNTLLESNNINLDNYLQFLETYFRESEPELYKSLKDKNLFDVYNYGIKVKEDMSPEAMQTKQETLQNLDQQIQILKNRITQEKNISLRNAMKNELVRLTTERISADTLMPEGLSEENVEVSWFKRWTGNLSVVSQPLIVAYKKLLDSTKMKFLDERNKLRYEFNKVQQDLMKEYNPNIGNIGLKYKTDSNQGLYDFMWVERTKNGTKGYYRVTETDPEWAQLSEVQKAYVKFFSEKLDSLYSEVANKVVYIDPLGKKLTNAEFNNQPSKLDEDFMPRVYMSFSDFTERNGLMSKASAAWQYSKFKNNFLRSEFYAKNAYDVIPFKHMGSEAIIGNQMHSFNAEMAFYSFTDNLLKKKYFDEAHSIGVGLVEYFKQNGEGTNAEFLNDRIITEVLESKKELKIGKKNFSYVGKDGKLKKVDVDTILGAVKNFVTAGSMWLKVGAGLKNAALIAISNRKKSLLGNISKQFGIDEEDIDFTEGNLLEADFLWLEYLKDSALGNLENNKINLLLKEFNYLPDSFDFKLNRNDLASLKNKALSTDHLYIAHSAFEQWGTGTIFVALLLHGKNKRTGKSLYDSYEVKEGKLVWEGGLRGKRQDGSEIQGLTFEELNKFKRISATIHGNYRPEEKGAIELYALGQMAMQFKRFVPQQLYNLWQSKQRSDAFGKFVEEVDPITGKPLVDKDGNTIYSWRPEVIEGRMRLLFKHLAQIVPFIAGNPDYKFSNLSPRQKQDLIASYMIVIQTAILFALGKLMFPDDEEETYTSLAYWKLLKDLSDGMNPVDMLDNFQNQSVSFVKLSKMAKASGELLYSVATGEKTQRGYYKGEIEIAKALPLFSSIHEVDKMLERVKKGDAAGLDVTEFDNVFFGRD